ncbi:protein of unknown function [Methylococcus capsulatus]|uniref:Uncharacterized protein n=1 Tax=Methylococcus capsulatus TaxID=414 RepID=A0AA35UGN7_METCP|nr:protein of unknown function [Methylococcus capsulatus]
MNSFTAMRTLLGDGVNHTMELGYTGQCFWGRDGLAVVSDAGNSELTGRSAILAPAGFPQGWNADDLAPSAAKATLLVSYWCL